MKIIDYDKINSFEDLTIYLKSFYGSIMYNESIILFNDIYTKYMISLEICNSKFYLYKRILDENNIYVIDDTKELIFDSYNKFYDIFIKIINKNTKIFDERTKYTLVTVVRNNFDKNNI